MSIVNHAKREFKTLNWPGDCGMQKTVCENVIEMLEIFASQGHSGTSAPYVLNLFTKLANFEPISPLTGEPDEWNDVGDDTLQNARCSEVFKQGARTYWIHGKIFRDPSGCTYTNSSSRVDIAFPWTRPEPEIVDVSEKEVQK